MSSAALYAPTVAVCEEIGLVPWTHVFVTFTFTFVLFVLFQRVFAGVGILPFIITAITLCWYIICIIIDVYRDYVFWNKKPDYRVFARCSLNKEYNEHLALKFTILTILAQKTVACLLAWDFGALPIKIFRFCIFLVKLFMIPVLVARGVAVLGATVGMGWAHCYFFFITAVSTTYSTKLQWNPGMLWMSAAETMVTGSDEEQDNAASIMTAAEGALVEAGEEVPSSPSGSGSSGVAMEPQQSDSNEPAANAAEDKHAKLRFYAEYFDKSSLLPKILFVLLYSISAYSAIIGWDWRYDQNGISYGQSFSAFDSRRPTIKTLYDNAGQISNEQRAYIASLWC